MDLIKKKIKYHYLESLLYTLIFSIAAHAIMFFNVIYQHDALVNIYSKLDNGYQISLCRFLQPVYLYFRGFISASWLIGLISIIFLSVGIYFIVKIFNIKLRSTLILLSGILATNTTLVFSYMSFLPWVDIYMLAFMLAVIAVYLLIKYKYGFVFGAIIIATSLGLYQAYFTVAIGIIMLYAIMQLIHKENFKKVIFNASKGALMLIGGAIIYLVTAKLILNILNIAMSTEYNSISNIADMFNNSFAGLIVSAYGRFVNELVTRIAQQKYILILLFFIIGCITIYYIINIINKKKLNILNIIGVFFIIMLLPLGMNSISVIAHDIYHSLMAYGCFMIFLLPLILYEENASLEENKINKVINLGLIISISIVIFFYIVFANQMYTQRNLTYQATASVMTRIVSKIEDTEGYIYGKTPIIFVGELEREDTTDNPFDELSSPGIYFPKAFSTTYHLTYYKYLKYVMNYSYVIPDENVKSQIIQSDYVKNMNSFPSKGYCKLIDGNIVVKLGN